MRPHRTASRRALLAGAGTAALASCGGAPAAPRPRARRVALPAPVPGLPAAQHAWDATLRADDAGNRLAPRHHRLLLFDLARDPGPDDARALEAALRGLETEHPHGPDGLLSTVGWGPAWLGDAVPAAEPLSDTEVPDLEDWAAVVHLASDRPGVLAAADARLARATGALRLRERRDGSVGAGLARRTARRLGEPAPPLRSPLLMGFDSGRRRTQAREDDVTIAGGPWAGGTTMHVSRLALTLPSWYRSLTDDERAAQMFGPGVTAAQARAAGPGLDPVAEPVAASARRHGLVGHAQAAATARRGGRPRIIRRDFNGAQDGRPMTHFVAVQADVADFTATRRAMNANAAVGVNGVDAVVNNGINEWLSVRSRANLLVPPRARRSFPGLEGWEA